MPATIPLAPFPAQNLRGKISPEDWQACVQAWILFVNKLLFLDDKAFASSAELNISTFLTSYIHQAALASLPGGPELHSLVFRLAIRTLKLSNPPSALLTFSFLSDFSGIVRPSSSLKETIRSVWHSSELDTSTEFSIHKRTFIAAGSKNDPEHNLDDKLLRISALMRSCPDYARFLLAGSEFIDVLISIWMKAHQAQKRKLVEVAFLALHSLILDPHPNPTALLDHLYDLKSAAETDKAGAQAQFLHQLVSNSTILTTLRQKLRDPVRARAQPLVTYLSTLDDGTLARKWQVRKGKRARKDSVGHGVVGEVHMHKMVSVSQIQELFPDLGAGFVVKLLDFYQDDVEKVTASLLEDSLPSELTSADRSELLQTHSITREHSQLEPRPTPPLEPQRRNVYDNDDFDKLAVSTRILHIGKKQADAPLQTSGDKARIYSALAAFDSDDDERDDSYDVEDVGGTVDVQGYDKDHEDTVTEQNTEALYRAWKMDSTSFQRDGTARKSVAREALRSETKMTDEVIEGFAIMLQRDPKRLRALQAKYPDFVGEQESIQSTKWRQNEDGMDDLEDAGSGARGRGRGRGQGHGGIGRQPRGRGRGNVAGPADDKDTQYARQRKDENKAQRANHNRRAQRAKKVARAGFPG